MSDRENTFQGALPLEVPVYPNGLNLDAILNNDILMSDTLTMENNIPLPDHQGLDSVLDDDSMPDIAELEVDIPEHAVPDTSAFLRGPAMAEGDQSGIVWPLPVPNKHPTADDWEAYRTIFKGLYLDKDLTLNEIRSFMKEKYGFNASWV